jgi:ribosomal protein S27AE
MGDNMICAFCSKHDRESAGSWVCSECLLKFDSQRQKVIDSIHDCQHWVWLDNKLEDDGICGTDGIYCSACQWKIKFFEITKTELEEAGVPEKPFCKTCGTKMIIHFGKATCPKCENIVVEKKQEIVEEPIMVPVRDQESIPIQVVDSSRKAHDFSVTLDDEPVQHDSPDRAGKLFVKCLTDECGNSFNLDVDDGGLAISKPCPRCGQENFAVSDDIKAFM